MSVCAYVKPVCTDEACSGGHKFMLPETLVSKCPTATEGGKCGDNESGQTAACPKGKVCCQKSDYYWGCDEKCDKPPSVPYQGGKPYTYASHCAAAPEFEKNVNLLKDAYYTKDGAVRPHAALKFFADPLEAGQTTHGATNVADGKYQTYLNRQYLLPASQDVKSMNGGSFKPVNTVISVTMNVSGLAGRENGNLYAVTPGVDPKSRECMRYCDANYVGGVGCPELDLIEANAYGFATTFHKCKRNASGDATSLDAGACDTAGNQGGFVPKKEPPYASRYGAQLTPTESTSLCTYGPGCYIDTTKDIDVKIAFPNCNENPETCEARGLDDGSATMWLQLKQDSRKAVASISPSFGLDGVSETLLNNMENARWALISSQWGCDGSDSSCMQWLSADKSKLSAPVKDAQTNPFTISNLVYSDLDLKLSGPDQL